LRKRPRVLGRWPRIYLRSQLRVLRRPRLRRRARTSVMRRTRTSVIRKYRFRGGEFMTHVVMGLHTTLTLGEILNGIMRHLLMKWHIRLQREMRI